MSIKKSPWVSFFNAGGCNGCTLEFLACTNPRYDVTRFGIEIRASAKQADVLVVTGIVNKHNKKRLVNLYEQLAEPKRVVSIGACALTGGIYKDSHAHAGPVDKVIPVTVYVPGCPPRPETIIHAIMEALKK